MVQRGKRIMFPLTSSSDGDILRLETFLASRYSELHALAFLQ
jgi:hypothetical protein